MESKEKIKKQSIKMNFFQKLWYSISKFEKYPEMATLGVKRAILYFTQLMLITSIIYTGIYIYDVYRDVKLEDESNFPEQMAKSLTQKANIEDEQLENLIKEILQNEKTEILTFSIGIAILISLFLATLIDVFTLSIFGILTCVFAKIKLNYKALFNMSIYAFTLSIILRTIYFAITILTTFKIKYFEIMYIAIAYISLAAAIFIIKSNVIKQHLELMRIIEESKDKIEEKFSINKKTRNEEKNNNDEDKKKEDEKKEDDDTEGQQSNA